MILEASRFIRNRTGIPWIPPLLRSLSHIKRRDLRGSESATKGGLKNPEVGGFNIPSGFFIVTSSCTSRGTCVLYIIKCNLAPLSSTSGKRPILLWHLCLTERCL